MVSGLVTQNILALQLNFSSKILESMSSQILDMMVKYDISRLMLSANRTG